MLGMDDIVRAHSALCVDWYAHGSWGGCGQAASILFSGLLFFV